METDYLPNTKRGSERHEKILDAAKQVFIEQGYARASINEIVRRSGGSLGTIYKFFGNKLGLFEAFFQKITYEAFYDFEEKGLWTEDIETSLLNFGRQLQQMMFEKEALAIYRLVLSEQGADHAEIQRIFMQYGPHRLNKILSRFLAQQTQAGLLQLDDCEIAAYQFVEMIKGPLHFRALFGESITPEKCEAVLKHAVKLFLNGAKVS
ncbi:TetR/AcrR family transcriptional regulator [Thiomicrospira microaerophila]|uniref:TetR/AcrR family transcriptional regulator n=1 Tax=Thiomicrospira microaerophila TaxID=406020 RepID=UPI00200C2141|nr:TetR/AcrR family transcriptional regulator [Thiomicrospira microaerophila]UQB42886.1 TetR/AcrR family transcriptional regulator [Thiomicrospira microaerophila]